MLKKLSTIILVFIFTISALPQKTENKNQKEKRAELEKESVAFLRETFGDVEIYERRKTASALMPRWQI